MNRRRIGSVEARPNGTFRARMRVDGKLETVGTFATQAEAEAALVLVAEGVQKETPIAGESLASWGRKFLDARELDGVHRSVERDRHAWKRVAAAPFFNLPLAAITTRDIRDWMKAQIRTPTKKGKPPARTTVANPLNLLRVALEEACEAGLLSTNVARDVRVPRMASTSDGWTWLRTDEIVKLLKADIDPEVRDIFCFAIYTGLRAGELFGLEWRDVDLRAGVMTIRHSWRGTPTKPGRVRTAHLLAPAIEALERQRERTKKYRHVFAGRDGEGRTRDQVPDLKAALKSIGITRRVRRIHDLRHTCASHLVSGSWGRAWTLEEVAQHLGHATSAVTRRYAHLCPEGIARAVRETRPEMHLKPLVLPVPTEVPTSSHESPKQEAALARKPLKSAEEKGFEPLEPLRDRRFSKHKVTREKSATYTGMGTVGERARALLERLGTGDATEGDVASLAAEVLANPPAVIAAAQRYLAAVGTEHAGMAAVAFLEAASTAASDPSKLAR